VVTQSDPPHHIEFLGRARLLSRAAKSWQTVQALASEVHPHQRCHPVRDPLFLPSSESLTGTDLPNFASLQTFQQYDVISLWTTCQNQSLSIA